MMNGLLFDLKSDLDSIHSVVLLIEYDEVKTLDLISVDNR